MAALIEVFDGGLGTTVQDGGRPGFRRFGVPLCGALDPLWLACANALAGNAAGAAALELRLTGPRLRVVGGRVRVALVGDALGELRRADAGRLTFHPWRSLTLAHGDELAVGAVRGGIAYLAFSGGIATPSLLGSRATHLRARMGGLDGRALAAGDRLPLGQADPHGPERRQAPFLHEGGPIRLIAGPQDDHFTPAALRALVEETFVVSRDVDRMGVCLDGPRLLHDARFGDEIVSDGVVPGAIQVPPDGRPILLGADCQTVGGYPKIATAIRADLPRLAHLLPGMRLRFAYVSREQALAALRAQQSRLAAWIAGIAPHAGTDGIDETALYGENLISGVCSAEES